MNQFGDPNNVITWSGETYEAIHELAEFGLIDIHDPMPNRRRGRITQHASRPMDDETGLAPILIDLMDRGFVTALAGNGSVLVHDSEIARVVLYTS